MGITFNHASFTFNGLSALENIHLSIGEGITAVMGPNGAGKTTLLQLAASILTPNAGELRLDGEPYAVSAGRLRRSLGFLPQAVDFPEHLTPRKLITYLAQLRFLEPHLGMQELERLEISSQADRRFGTLSMGEIRLVGIALALMGTPGRLILDEPFHGLDVLERERVLRCLRNPCPDRTILFATQLPQEVETFADRVVVLRAGKIIFKGTVEEFRRIAEQRVWEITAPLQQIEQLQIHGARVIRNSGEMTTIRGLGKPPQYVQAILVMPTVEDAYFWLMRQYERNANK